jgi:transposase
MIIAERAARLEAEAVAASAKAEAANAKAAEALINYLKLEIEKLRRQIYGSRSERKARLLEQMELQLEESEATATEDELAAERAAAQTQAVKSFQRKRPSRKPLPDHLPRERVVIAAPQSCPCCGSSKLSKLGEDITETLEVIPRQWKVIQTVREKFSCRDCETITQPPAPFHVTPRGFAGPNLLAMILFEKVRSASALEPPKRALPAGGHRFEPVDSGRPGRRLYGGPSATSCVDRAPRAGRRAASWR